MRDGIGLRNTAARLSSLRERGTIHTLAAGGWRHRGRAARARARRVGTPGAGRGRDAGEEERVR